MTSGRKKSAFQCGRNSRYGDTGYFSLRATALPRVHCVVALPHQRFHHDLPLDADNADRTPGAPRLVLVCRNKLQ